MKTRLVLCAILVFTTGTAARQHHFDGKTLWRHVEVLAADDMEGRAPGSAGLERAEAYVVDQLQKAGLAPAGVNGYFQPVKLVKREVVETDSSAALVRNGETAPLVLGEDAFFTNDVDQAPKVEAPLVFLGYGLQIPKRTTMISQGSISKAKSRLRCLTGRTASRDLSPHIIRRRPSAGSNSAMQGLSAGSK